MISVTMPQRHSASTRLLADLGKFANSPFDNSRAMQATSPRDIGRTKDRRASAL
jgi:hypothetical protein